MNPSRKARKALCRTRLLEVSRRNYGAILSSVLDHEPISHWKDEVLGLLRSKSYKKLLDLADSIGQTEYPSAATHYAANQLAALIKKYQFEAPILGVNPEEEAMNKFAKAEKLCKRYNEIWRKRREVGFFRVLLNEPVSPKRAHRRVEERSRILFRSKEWIRKVIGDEPNYSKIWTECGFGPGASVGVSGNATHMAAKLLAPRWSITPSALPYALAALRNHSQIRELLCKKEGTPYYSEDSDLFERRLLERVHYVTHNKITLVPKTAKVHRTIAVEPLLNGFVQKGIDEFLRSRLFRFGIDLKDQSRNQALARIGSLPDADPYTTIDLSQASDSICLELVRELLPPAWFAFLNATRAVEYAWKGKKQTYHKFVSMGNGFCFPLETLIFSSVCVAACEVSGLTTDFSVYGDDIIVRQSIAPLVLSTLRFYGFRHNPEKTFLNGPFRESCGADWYLGEDVRPVTLDYAIGENPRDAIKFHNSTLRSINTTVFFGATRKLLFSLVSPRNRLVRPYKGDPDTAFEVDMSTFMGSPFSRWNRETWSWSWREYLTISPDDSWRYHQMDGWSTVLVMAALQGATSAAPFTKRRNTRTRMRRVSHHGGQSTWLPYPA